MLTIEHHDGVTSVTLNRPDKGNALGPEMVEALLARVEQVSADDATHTLVLRGAGAHLCTGLDLTDLPRLSDAELLLRVVRIEALLAALWHAPMRTVAVAHGRTWGAGADLFTACEKRIARPGTSFRFPGAQFGLVLGSRRLAERIGTNAARRLVIEGGELDAAQGLQSGLVSVVAADGAEPPLPPPRVSRETARAVREVTRADHRDADLAALVRTASVPGLHARITAYRERLLLPRGAAG